MKTLDVLVTDFSRDVQLSIQLCRMLSACEEPAIKLHHLREEDPLHAVVHAKQLAALDSKLVFLTFDELPKPGVIKRLVEGGGSARPVHAVVISPFQSALEMRALFREGAADVWSPPLRLPEVVGRTLHLLDSGLEGNRAIEQMKRESGLRQFVGKSPLLLKVLDRIPAIAISDAAVLIRGETGTGKEICARSIHYLSHRCDRPFAALNCAGLVPELFENELFGHIAGAFTGATSTASGLLAQIDQGTLLLDEIDSLPLAIQAKLLRFIEDKEYRPLGPGKLQRADARILAATNADLMELVRAGRFRKDLYYRLKVLEVALPPLRDRLGDIQLIAESFLERAAKAAGKPPKKLSAAAKLKLEHYTWPGNVRELQNVISQAVILGTQPMIEESDIGFDSPEADLTDFKTAKARAVDAFVKAYVTKMLKLYDGNISRAAKAARKERSCFCRLIDKHNVRTSLELLAATAPLRESSAYGK